ncbi:hypothetical protein ABPG72_020450 [Tetrahymena utriculariae]
MQSQNQNCNYSQLFTPDQYLQKLFDDQRNPQNYNQNCILKELNQKEINELERIICKDGFKIRMILGSSGCGKSSLIKRITNENILVSNSQDSCTQECKIYVKDGIKYIDTPGLNDTRKPRYQILLEIIQFLFKENIKIEQLFFVYVSNKKLQTQQKDINELVYTYFLYELFAEQIKNNPKIIEKLLSEFLNSNYFLKWVECNYHNNQDKYSQFRIEIYKQKDKTLNYIQYANSYHIFIHTFFDQELEENLQELDEQMIDHLKEQIWSNIADSELKTLEAYENYILEQEKYLNEKILRIIELAKSYYQNDNIQEVQNILIIGKSQVGKSALIEQLTQYLGLRGDSYQSESRYCEIYSIIYENVKYNFIDTPGYAGTESRNSYLDNLKLIADFLRRNKIQEFKILFVRDADKDCRNQDQIIKQFLVFITELFDQEVTLVDQNMLEDIIKEDLNNEKMTKNIRQVKDRMIQVERVKKRDKKGQIYFNNFEIKSVQFKCNYTTDKGKFVKIEKEEDEVQKQTLFKAINSIDTLSIEDKIHLKITKIYDFQIITDAIKYLELYERVFILYLQLSSTIAQINEGQNNQVLLQDLITKKLDIQKKLDTLQFGLLTNFNEIVEVQNGIQKLFFDKQSIIINENENQEYKIMQQNRFKNNIQRHFLILYQWNSYLFLNQSQSENILLSRKQLHFWNLQYHLQDVIDLNQKKNQQILEELAQLKVIKEINTYQHIQNGLIDAFLYEDQERLNFTIQQFFQAMDKIIGVGGEGFRNMTYFSYNAKLLITSFKAIKEVNKILLALNVVASLASIGFDFSSYQKKYICSEQMQLNTASNVLSGFLGVAAFLIPGIGWIVGGIAAAIGLIGNLFSQFSFTDKEQFDKTIGLFFKDFLNENKVKLLYFQKADMLKKKFSVEFYSQPQCKQSYDCCRELEKDNFISNKKILSKIHRGTSEQTDEQLKDKISQYINKEIMMNKLCTQFDDIQLDKCNTSIQEIKQCVIYNNQIIETYFNHFYVDDKKKKIFDEINSILDCKDCKKEIDDFLKIKDPTEEKLRHLNKCIKNYSLKLKKFIDQNKQKDYHYFDYVEFANGLLRKDSNFKILFNSYSNLTVEKQKYICQQNLISEIELSSDGDCFVLKNGFESQQFFRFKNTEIQVLLEQISLLSNSEAFISSRYLQKFKGREEFNLSFCSRENNLENNLEESLDLLPFLKENEGNISEEEFMKKVLNQFQKIDSATYTRIQSFYRSYFLIQEQFQK